MYARFSELKLRSSTSDDNPHTYGLLEFIFDGFLKYVPTHASPKLHKIPCFSLTIYCRIMENIHPHRTCNWNICVVTYPGYGCISILSSSYSVTRCNVTLNIVIGPFVRMTLQSRRSCVENRPVCGNR